MSNNDKNEVMFNALLKAAINEKFQEEIDALPTNEELNELYKPSAKLDLRIKKLINKNYRKSKMQSFQGNYLKSWLV